jgi:adenylate cyclase
MQIRLLRNLNRVLAVVVGALLSALLGLACLEYSLAEHLRRLSYDLPFLWRSTLDTHEITIVYLDEASARQLNQPLDDVWNRALHVPLLDRLTREKARLVFYDISFDGPAADPRADESFAQSIQANGRVILGGVQENTERQGVYTKRIFPPIKPLRKAALGWGLLVFSPVDPDYGVRQIYFGTSQVPTATWKAAQVLGAPVTNQSRDKLEPLWVNYYGPRNSFSSISLARALEPDGLPPGYFKDKIVFLGGQFTVGALRVGRDEFATPYSRLNGAFTPGTEVHATILLNLLRNEWLTRMPVNQERALVILIGLLAGGLGIGFFRPVLATFITIVLSLGIAAAACWLVWHRQIWFAWLIPSAVQMPFGLAWAVSSQYLLESRRRKALRKAFGFYLSPQMADRISDSDFDLRPGGKVVDASVMFTDLENFTTLSEDLDPAEVSSILIAYFEQTTRSILENKGTIIKYVGDAVMAAWGAPIDEPAHAIRAAEAACDLRCLTEMEIHGKRLRTRIGLHSGQALAGNLGSSFRFDYTVIGDTTNFASRLESLNKYLGTQVLISEAVRKRLEDKFITRRLGEFRVAGKTHSVVIHELLCRCEAQKEEKVWIDTFEAGLELFRTRKFDGAAEMMNRTHTLRGEPDGPAAFYIRKIAALGGKEDKGAWDGIIELTEK